MAEHELAEWQAYWRLEPPMAERLEIMIGLLLCQTANLHRDPKRTPESYQLKDVLPQWGRTEPEPEPEAEPKEAVDPLAPDRVLGMMRGMMKRQQDMKRKRQKAA